MARAKWSDGTGLMVGDADGCLWYIPGDPMVEWGYEESETLLVLHWLDDDSAHPLTGSCGEPIAISEDGVELVMSEGDLTTLDAGDSDDWCEDCLDERTTVVFGQAAPRAGLVN